MISFFLLKAHVRLGLRYYEDNSGHSDGDNWSHKFAKKNESGQIGINSIIIHQNSQEISAEI